MSQHGDNTVGVLLKLLHLAYLATGEKGVRDALEAIRALLQGDARRAHGLVARLAGGRLPRPPERRSRRVGGGARSQLYPRRGLRG